MQMWFLWPCDVTVISISIMWCQWPHQLHQCICLLKITKMRFNTSTFLASQDANGIKIGTITFLRSRQLKWGVISLFGHWYHWHWILCHMILTVLPMAPLHSPHQDNWNEVQHHGYDHVTPLVLTSTLCDSNSIINGSIAFLWTRWSKWSATLLFLLM